MEVLKRLAPNYWAGYYAVYAAMTVYLAIVFFDELRKWPQTESLFAAAAIFAVSAGSALISAFITEGVGYVVLLIPRRIKEIKDAGIEEGHAKGRVEGREEGREEGHAKGRVEGREEGLAEGIEKGRAQAFAEMRAGPTSEGNGSAPAEEPENGRAQALAEGIEAGRVEESKLVDGFLALYDSGEITAEQLHTLLTYRHARNRNGG